MIDKSKKLTDYYLGINYANFKDIVLLHKDNDEVQNYLDNEDYLIIIYPGNNIYSSELIDIIGYDLQTYKRIHHVLYAEGLRWHFLFRAIKKEFGNFASDNKEIIEDDFHILYDINDNEIVYIPTYTQLIDYENEIGISYLYVDINNISDLEEQALLDILKILNKNYSTWGNLYQSVKRILINRYGNKYFRTNFMG